MRARNIKPGFYKNPNLVECSAWARLLAPGLWMMADREGRLLDRPKHIKMDIFPADTIDVEPLLQELHTHKHILRYEINGIRYIQILGFSEHQSPHHLEKPSNLPAPLPVDSEKENASSADILGQDRDKTEIRLGSISPDSLIPDCSSIEEYKKQRTQEISEFQERHRLQAEIPGGWIEICRQEMGFAENVVRDIWIKFSGHWKRQIGHKALKTDEEWGAEWRTWYRSSHIKPRMPPAKQTLAKPTAATL